jgi:hypothetical protein
MNQQPAAHPDYDSLQSVFSANAQWVEKYRRGTGSELKYCSPEQVASIAHELGVHPTELVNLAKKGPHAADLLNKLLRAIGIEPNELAHHDPLVMRDLQRLCSTCGFKRQCEFDLANGESADNFREYCPNTFTIDALLQEKQ